MLQEALAKLEAWFM